MRTKSYISLSALVIMAYVIIRVTSFYPRWTHGVSEATISWDVYGYYLYLPAFFIYDDLAKLEFKDEMFEKYRPAGDFHHAVPQPNGNWVMKYPIGMAVIYTPFFLGGHAYATMSDAYAADGFSMPYQLAISLAGLFYALLGLWFMRKVLLHYFSDLVAASILAILVLCTNYLNYVSFDGAMPHNALFSLFAIILWLTIKWHEKPDWRYALGLGVAIGLSTIIRPTEILISLVPLFWGVYNKESFQQKWQLLWTNRLQVLILIGATFLMGLIQMLYWKSYSGHFLYYSYEEFGFDWLRPHLWSGLFSFRKGWFIYTPVMILAVLGFIPLYKHHREKFFALAGHFVITLYIVFAWQVWWYGGSFGARPLVQSYALLAFPLGAFLTWVFQQKWRTIAVAVFVFLCADLNLLMTWQAHARDGNWEAEYMTKAYFWKIFGKTNPDKADRKFLSVKHELGSTDGMTVKTLFETDFEQDTSGFTTERHVFEGKKAYLLNEAVQFSPTYETRIADLKAKPGSWVRVSVQYFYTNMQWNRWQMTQLATIFFRGEKMLRASTPRMHWLTDAWRWTPLQYEMRIPKNLEPDDLLKVYVWNAGSPTEMFIDNFKVELIEPED
ncbi:MAG: hypothetical protein AAFR61_10565 [Bacteroidota bacterium]